MPKGLAFDQQFLQLIFQGTTNASLFSAAGTQATLYVALHTADPTTVAGSGTVNTQNASEATYTSYARVGVVRSAAGWAVTNNTVTPVANITFPAGTGGSGTVTNWSVGTALSGATPLLWAGTVSPSIVTGNGITPILTNASVITET
jgi:hypothetical protein